MLDRLRAYLTPDQNSYTISPEDAAALYEEHHRTAIEQAREAYEDHRATVFDAVEAVDDAMQELKTHEDDLTVVEDVAANVARDRRRAIDRFDPPDDPHAFHNAAAALVEELKQVTPKEQKVLDRVGEPASQAFDTIHQLEDRVDALEAFLDEEYSAVEQYERVQELVETLDDQRADRRELQEQLDAIDLETPRATLDDVEQELAELADDPRHDEKAAVRDAIAELEDDRTAYVQQIDAAMAKMERGLKKLLYAARNGDIELDAEQLEILEAVKDGRLGQEYTPPAADVAAAVAAAEDRIDQVDLSDRQQEKFHTGVETLQEIDDLRDTINDLSEQIAEKQEELEAYTLDEEREELERQRERIQDRIADRAEQRKTLRQELRATEAAIDDTRDQIEELLNNALDATVTITATHEDEDDTAS